MERQQGVVATQVVFSGCAALNGTPVVPLFPSALSHLVHNSAPSCIVDISIWKPYIPLLLFTEKCTHPVHLRN